MMVRVLIVDDHAVVRDGLKMILESQGDIVVVGTVANGRESITQAEKLCPDVILMDISMPELNGLEAAEIICRQKSSPKVIMLSMHHTNEHLHRAVRSGAHGYLLKESAGHEVVSAVRAVFKGLRYIGEGIDSPHEFLRRHCDLKCKSPIDSLSNREREVMQLVVEGKTSAQIADILAISPKSVETYRSRLMNKLGISNIPSLVKFAIHHAITPSM